MKTYPIQFSPPMVQRLLDGSKTRTRRTVTSMWANLKMHHEMGTPCYLWTQEGFAYYGMNAGHIFYRATDSGNLRWRPSIHMPRWASRLTLEVTDVRLQRLQEISHEDVLAEGVTADQVYDSVKAQRGYFVGEAYRNGYRNLWESLHGEGTWEDNPEVIALTFRVHHCNVDDLIKQKTA